MPARHGHIIPGFTNNLLSLGKLCDADCTAHLNKHTLLVNDKFGKPVLQGKREEAGARLWRVDIAPTPTRPSLPTPQQPPPTPNSDNTVQTTNAQTTSHAHAYDLPNTPGLIAYLHATAGYPVKSTWLQAIKRGAYKTWPGLTYALADADETIKGHMAQPRQHIRSTQRTAANHATSLTDPHKLMVEVHVVPINRIFTDDTGRFTPRARSGNQYIMVTLHGPSNAILVRPFASKHDSHRIAAYNDVYDRLSTAGQAPTLHILDNEVSGAFQKAITANNCTFQLVPPNVHRRNAAERAICTFKDHFLAILAGTAPNFPRDRWDLLLPQAELTLNLLRLSPTKPDQSAWEHLFGPYNFDATPMGPAGSRVIIHSKAQQRHSWEYRGHDGFYIGPALKHYRCYRVLNKVSHAVAITDALKFRHH